MLKCCILLFSNFEKQFLFAVKLLKRFRLLPTVPMEQHCFKQDDLHIGSSLYVAFHVQGQMVTPREGSLAEMALERTIASVLSVMPCKFVRSGELPSTAFPCAGVWFFTSVCSQVRLEMGAFGVRFVAARVCAGVAGLTFSAPGSSASLLWLSGG